MAEDQADRADIKKMDSGTADCDRKRRMRIGEFFGEGCLQSAEDFQAAALVYQHGDAPEHFFQANIWAKRSIELGNTTKSSLMALAIDRYLINTGRKQFFGSQAMKPNNSECWCMQTVESTYPAELREKYLHMSLDDKFAWVDSLNKNADCPKKVFCDENPPLKDTPAGSVPGLW